MLRWQLVSDELESFLYIFSPESVIADLISKLLVKRSMALTVVDLTMAVILRPGFEQC